MCLDHRVGRSWALPTMSESPNAPLLLGKRNCVAKDTLYHARRGTTSSPQESQRAQRNCERVEKVSTMALLAGDVIVVEDVTFDARDLNVLEARCREHLKRLLLPPRGT